MLIAVLVLAIGLLGIAGLQGSALTNNFTSYQYTQAATLGQSMLERMRANRRGVVDGDYTLPAGQIPPNPPVDCSNATCTLDQQAAWDLAVWYASLHGTTYTNAPTIAPIDGGTHIAVGLLPNGEGSISCPAPFKANSICMVTVYWAGSPDTGHSAGGSRAALYSCDPRDDNALRCFRLAFAQ